jgi:hypothetical protein
MSTVNKSLRMDAEEVARSATGIERNSAAARNPWPERRATKRNQEDAQGVSKGRFATALSRTLGFGNGWKSCRDTADRLWRIPRHANLEVSC